MTTDRATPTSDSQPRELRGERGPSCKLPWCLLQRFQTQRGAAGGPSSLAGQPGRRWGTWAEACPTGPAVHFLWHRRGGARRPRPLCGRPPGGRPGPRQRPAALLPGVPLWPGSLAGRRRPLGGAMGAEAGGGRRRVLRACLGQPRKRSHQRPGGRRQSCAAQKHVFTEDRFESSPWNLTRQEPRTAEDRRGPRPLRSSS